MSAFERTMIQRLIDQATEANIPVPDEIRAALDRAGHDGNTGATLWLELNPDEDKWPVEAISCCDGAALYGPDRCMCWSPVYDIKQADPRPPTCPEDLAAMPRMCGDCAFRKGSPERADVWSEETLMELTVSAIPFWCHSGMRRPAYWHHPQLGDVPGSTADWKPPIVANIPYQADGSPGLLCAGWAARAARNSVLAETDREAS